MKAALSQISARRRVLYLLNPAPPPGTGPVNGATVRSGGEVYTVQYGRMQILRICIKLVHFRKGESTGDQNYRHCEWDISSSYIRVQWVELSLSILCPFILISDFTLSRQLSMNHAYLYLSMRWVRLSSPDSYEKFKVLFADTRQHLMTLPGFLRLTWWEHSDDRR